jgi:hypothetical protein
MVSRKFVDTNTMSFPPGAWAHVKVESHENTKNNLDSAFAGMTKTGSDCAKEFLGHHTSSYLFQSFQKFQWFQMC